MMDRHIVRWTLDIVSQKKRILCQFYSFNWNWPQSRSIRMIFFIVLYLHCSARAKVKVWLSVVFLILLMITSDPALEHILNGVQRSL